MMVVVATTQRREGRFVVASLRTTIWGFVFVCLSIWWDRAGAKAPAREKERTDP
jgi:hypothetical protein